MNVCSTSGLISSMIASEAGSSVQSGLHLWTVRPTHHPPTNHPPTHHPTLLNYPIPLFALVRWLLGSLHVHYVQVRRRTSAAGQRAWSVDRSETENKNATFGRMSDLSHGQHRRGCAAKLMWRTDALMSSQDSAHTINSAAATER